MKRISPFIAACLAVSLLFAGCGDKKESKPIITDSSPVVITIPTQNLEHQNDEECEEAFRELFTALYTANCGDTFFKYMYPDEAIEKMKSTGEYASLVTTYNSNQSEFVAMMKKTPEITEFTSVTPLTESQISAAKRYLVNLSKDVLPDLTVDDLVITEGFEVKCNIINYNDKEDTDTECMVKLEGDGWKAVTFSAEGLEQNFPETETE